MKSETYPAQSCGFTLIELIVVILISGIIAVTITNFITHPIEGYQDLQRRTQLVDAAEMALQKMARDIRQALPNSIRTNTTSIGMINTLDAGIYRIAPPPGPLEDLLEFGFDDGVFSGDNRFTIYGKFKQIDLASALPENIALAINSTNSTDIYAQSVNADRTNGTENYVITPPGITVNDISNDTYSVVTLSAPVFLTPFSSEPPELATSIQGRRVFLVNRGITYKCQDSQLKRYGDHPLTETIGEDPDVVPDLLAAHVDCANTSFKFDPGSALRGALATLKITLTNSGETITLLHQVHVSNTP